MLSRVKTALAPAIVTIFALVGPATAQSFTTAFDNNTIGVGAVSTLRYTIEAGSTGLRNVNFTHSLPTAPGAMTVADNGVSTNCAGATVSAVAGQATVSLSNVTIPRRTNCTVEVNVTAPAAGSYASTTGILNHDAGTIAAASATLTVDGALPRFSKSFSPATVNINDVVTMIYQVDNSDGAAINRTLMTITETLPTGFVVAPIPNQSTTCGLPNFAQLTAAAGTPNISARLTGVNAGTTCTYQVDIVPSAFGTFTLTSGDLLTGVALNENSGNASADLTVNPPSMTGPTLVKRFDPGQSGPGGQVNLIYQIFNSTRSNATNIAFTDDLNAALAGATINTSGGSGTCGGAVTSTGTATLNFTGGSVASGASCQFSIGVTIPASAAAGTVTSTSSSVTAMVNGASVTENPATDTLQLIANTPVVVATTFLDNPAAAGGETRLQTTITNPGPNAATSISLTHDLAAFGDPVAINTLPAAGSSCGAGASFVRSGTTSVTLSNGELAAGASCTFSYTIGLPQSLAGVPITATTNFVTSDGGGGTTATGNRASASLNVNAGANLSFDKTFTDDPVVAGNNVTLRFRIASAAESTVTATNVGFTDDLNAMLAGAAATNLPIAAACGPGGTLAGTSTLTLTGASIAPGEECILDVTVAIPASAVSGSFPNTANLTATAGAFSLTDTATDTLVVRAVDESPLTLTKRFIGNSATAPALPGDVVQLEYTLTNPNPSAAATTVLLFDAIGATFSGLAATTPLPTNPCGAGSTISGTNPLNLGGGTLNAGQSCIYQVPIQIPTSASAGAFPSTSGGPIATISGALRVGDTAAANLHITTTPLTFTKAFQTNLVAAGSNLDLVYTIQNTSAANGTNIRFSEDIGAVISGTSITNVSGTCGGTPFIAGTNFDLTNVSLSAGQTCTHTIRLAIPASTTPTEYTSTTFDITGDFNGNNLTSPGASDSVTVFNSSAAADISVTKTDGVTSVLAGGSTTYTMVVSNAGPQPDPTVAVADTFPSGLTCNYTSTATGGALNNTASGTGNISDTLGMPSGSSVTYTAVCAVAGSATGTLTNTITATGSVGDPASGNNSATDTTTVTPNADISITKTDGLTQVVAGNNVTYTIVASNAGPSANPSVSVTDNFDARLQSCSWTAAATGGATGFDAVGTGNIADVAISMPSGSSVTYTVGCTVAATASGTLTNTATVSNGSVQDTNAGNNSATDSTAIVQQADISVTKADSLTNIVAGANTQYAISVRNLGPSTAPAVTLADTLPSDLTCSFTAAASGGATGFTSSGSGDLSETLAMPAGSRVDYTVNCSLALTASGSLANTATVSSSVTDPVAANNSATDTNTITAVMLGFSKAFGPNSIPQGGTSTLTFTIDNAANSVTATGLSFTSTLPSGVTVAAVSGAATTCTGGTVTASGNSISYSGGSVAGGASCTVSANVTASVVDTYNSTSSVLTSNYPDTGTASSTLTVTAAPVPSFTKVFAPVSINIGETSRLTLTVDNRSALIPAGNLNVTDTFPAGMVLAATPNLTNTCGGTPSSTSGSITLAGGSVAASSTCEVAVTVQATAHGNLVNLTGDLTSVLGNSGTATDTLFVSQVPLTMTMSFAPASIEQFRNSVMTITLRNTATIAATNISVNNALTAGVVVASTPNASTTCSGGTMTAAPGSTNVQYTGGSLAAGATCTMTASVTSNAVGNYPDTVESASSNLGTSTGASATLSVTPATTGDVTFVVNSAVDGSFGFASSLAALTTSVNSTGGTGTSGALIATAGSHSVSIAPPAGAAVTAIACNDTDSTSSTNPPSIALNLAVSENVTCTITAEDAVAKTNETINTFLTTRADLLLSTEPSRGRRIDRLRTGSGEATRLAFSNGDLKALLPFTAQVSQGDLNFSTSLRQAREAAASVRLAHGSTKSAEFVENHRVDAWFEAQLKKYSAGATEGDFTAAHFGVDYLLNQDVLLGAMVSLDRTRDQGNSSSLDGFGWMAGPYLTARLAPNLYFDGRLAAGTSTNEISPFNTYTDTFHTDRVLAMASLSGDFQRGNWTIQPNASLSYLREHQQSYVDSTNATIPSRTVELGQFQMGPTFTGRFIGDQGEIYSPYFAFDALYNYAQNSNAPTTAANVPSTNGWRGRVNAGVNVTGESGAKMGFGLSYDGLGRDSYEAWGVTVDFLIPLSKGTSR